MSKNYDVSHIPRYMRYLDTGRTVSPASPAQLYAPTPQTPSKLTIDVNKANNNPELKHISEAQAFNREKDARLDAVVEQRKKKKEGLYSDGFYRSDGKFIRFANDPVRQPRYNPYDYSEEDDYSKEYPPSLTFAGKNRKTKSRKSSKKKTKPRKSSKKKTKRRNPKSRKTKRRNRK